MTPSSEQVSQMLAQDIQSIEQLQQTLEQERAALEQRDLSALPPVIEAKNQLMAALGEHALQRQAWLDSTGLSRDHEGWQQWLKQRPETASQVEEWQHLAERFAHCRELNEINGKIIHRSQQTLGQMLNLMRGQNNEGPSLYDARGHSGSSGGSQTLGKA
ncbi:flagella synthesis protein FlgN [Marinimicrobium locisalis]|uniref:flagella synthesis protein FlgN n=1 Tax=Marinimicrobium locisalis TaxID=546022 RepID=UPI00322193E5